MSDDLNLLQRIILRREFMNWLKLHWPSIAAFGGAVIPFLLPSLLTYVAAHPHTTIGVLLGCVVAAYNSTAPKDAKRLQ